MNKVSLAIFSLGSAISLAGILALVCWKQPVLAAFMVAMAFLDFAARRYWLSQRDSRIPLRGK